MKFYDRIAQYYDAENQTFTDDLPFYVELAETYGDPVMDVGCGTGRVLLHLAQAGFACVGVDYSSEMLAAAKRKFQKFPTIADQIKLVEADILEYADDTRFSLITIPYNGLMHFREQATQLKVLQHLRNLLTDDGVMVIDLPNAGEAYASDQHQNVVLERTFVEPVSGNLVMQQSVSSIDLIDQRLNIMWIYDEIQPDQTLKRTIAPLVLRYVFPAEMQLLLKLTGFEIVEQFGDYERGEFVEGCPRMIVIAKKADA